MEGKRKGDLKILAQQTVISSSPPSSLSSWGRKTYVYLNISLYIYRSIFKTSKSIRGEYDIY